jgi:protein-L-isoaspartate O-methyltransferase
MHSITWQAYDEASSSFFETYESLKFSRMHRAFLPFLPAKGAFCLDVGAGSGRDAAALARRGYQVTAVEPSEGLRLLAERRHAKWHITWIDDALPGLSTLCAKKQRYQFILLSAVWMHIPPELRAESLRSLGQLLAPGGCIAFTLRLGSGCSDRIMYPVNVNQLIDQAQQFGLHPIYVSRKVRDSLKRGDVVWQKIIFSRQKSPM